MPIRYFDDTDRYKRVLSVLLERQSTVREFQIRYYLFIAGVVIPLCSAILTWVIQGQWIHLPVIILFFTLLVFNETLFFLFRKPLLLLIGTKYLGMKNLDVVVSTEDELMLAQIDPQKWTLLVDLDENAKTFRYTGLEKKKEDIWLQKPKI